MPDDIVAKYAHEMSYIFREHKRSGERCDIARLTLIQAYAVQEQLVAQRVRTQGKVVGWKIGCTSAAIRQQFGLSQPISGRLFEEDISVDGAVLPVSSYVDCAVEPELVFRLGADLEGDVSQAQVALAIATVAAGIELHNYRFWYGRPTSQELIASNGMHAGVVIGEEKQWSQGLDINSEGVSLLINGDVRAAGLCSEIMEHGPLRSVQWLAQHVTGHGQRLRAGDVVIPGSAVQLVYVNPSDNIEARFTTIGSCRARMD